MLNKEQKELLEKVRGNLKEPTVEECEKFTEAYFCDTDPEERADLAKEFAAAKSKAFREMT